MPTSRSYRNYLLTSLQNPEEAAAYLEAVLEDGTAEEISLALSNIAEAQQATVRDRPVSLNPENADLPVSQAASALSSLQDFLHSLGFQLASAPRTK